MVDARVQRILGLSAPQLGAAPHVRTREREFADLSKTCFANPPLQPAHLENYGFGLQEGVNAVVPFCVSGHVVPPTLGQYPEIAKLIAAIQKFVPATPYPILAGSAVFLGVAHANCKDVDLVTYVPIGTRDDDRRAVGLALRNLVNATNPPLLKAKIQPVKKQTGQSPPPPKELGNESRKQPVALFLNNILGNNPANPNPNKVGSLVSAQLKFEADPESLGKQITLQIHFTHLAFDDTNIHPYQELPECSEHNFFHTNKTWLAESFLHYFRFLYFRIAPTPVKDDLLKATKRAAMLAGMAGMWVEQKLFIEHLNGTAPLSRAILHNKINELHDRVSPLEKAGII